MKQIIGLFSNQKGAGEAVRALENADLGESKIRTVNEWEEDMGRRLDVMPVSHPTSGLSGVVGPKEGVDTAAELGDEGAEFFKRSVERGGVLVLVDLSDEAYKNRTESILEKQNAVAVSAAEN